MASRQLIHGYRIQPAGLDILGHRSETSAGTLDDGVHVFSTLADAAQAVKGWVADGSQPELVTILCDPEDLAANEDYEGALLLDSAGTIIARHPFADWEELYDWAAQYLEEHQ
jgi:hypothetical protein